MAWMNKKNKKSFLAIIISLLKKLYEFFFVVEFGVKKSKTAKQDKTAYHPYPQYGFQREHQAPRQGVAESKPQAQDLPSGYIEDKIVLQVRDPWWLHSYWEVTHGTRERLRNSLGDRYYQADWVIRVYDVSFIVFDGTNANRYFDISVGHDTNNWYINVSSGRSYCVDLGLRLNDGTFITIVRSNTVMTPLDGPSWILDEEWMILDEEFMRLYGVGFGSSPGAKRRMRKLKEYISSWGFLSRMTKEK